MDYHKSHFISRWHLMVNKCSKFRLQKLSYLIIFEIHDFYLESNLETPIANALLYFRVIPFEKTWRQTKIRYQYKFCACIEN